MVLSDRGEGPLKQNLGDRVLESTAALLTVGGVAEPLLENVPSLKHMEVLVLAVNQCADCIGILHV